MGLGVSLLVVLPALDGLSLFGTELSVWAVTTTLTGVVGASIIDRILEGEEDDDDWRWWRWWHGQ
ncbi:MAG: hypothetical protein J07HN6_00199 [Halonotius sp. J07HN6]|nr:MAG: hypothetical protein J07HN6_00199 [Halonotius sp. J07HN6]